MFTQRLEWIVCSSQLDSYLNIHSHIQVRSLMKEGKKKKKKKKFSDGNKISSHTDTNTLKSFTGEMIFLMSSKMMFALFMSTSWTSGGNIH